MEDKIAKEIQRLKDDIFRRKKDIYDIEKLINKDIDKEFRVDLMELSEMEFESYIQEWFSKKYPKLEFDLKFITSHRKILGKPIVLIKRFILKLIEIYLNKIFKKQTHVNQQPLVLFQNSRQNKEIISQMLERFADSNKGLAIMIIKLKKTDI